MTVWNITNVLPLRNSLEKGIAAFLEEIPRRLIKLFSFTVETVLDPFLGSGTTMKVARELGRNSWGYEVDLELKCVIKEKLTASNGTSMANLDFVFREDSRKLRTSFVRKIRSKHSVASKTFGQRKATRVQALHAPRA